ncbi:MAG TPA: prolyl oligopeptidase family serine peptidase, partial [Planctomycetaceae bacterium]
TWPAQIHDVKAAIRWVRANAERHGLDPDRIGVWGTSAGGHLVAMLGVSGDVSELEGDLGPHTDVSSEVAAVANFFGPTELLAMIGQKSSIDRTGPNCPEAKLIGGTLRENPEKAKAASPVTYVTPNDPPVLTVHGTEDFVVPFDQGVRFDKVLREAGVTSYFVPVEGAGHGDFRGDAVAGRLEAFFAKHLLGREVDVSTEPINQRSR